MGLALRSAVRNTFSGFLGEINDFALLHYVDWRAGLAAKL
jgi:hypothetical protein